MIRWRVETDPATRGGIGLISVMSDLAGACEAEAELDAALEALGVRAPVGALRLVDLLGIDRGLLARWSPRCAHLMPHAGPAVVRALAAEIERWLGAAVDGDGRAAACRTALLARYPEAEDEIEALMLDALARAASPLAIDLLLDQPQRWRALDAGTRARLEGARSDVGLAPAELSRLIEPPLVVAVGPANIGKSSLLNALAGRSVALVANEPGTTRDYVGVLLDVGGLVVRYADTPGLREGGSEVEVEARAAAMALAREADLVLLCGDAGAQVGGVFVDIKNGDRTPSGCFGVARRVPGVSLEDSLQPPALNDQPFGLQSDLNSAGAWRFHGGEAEALRVCLRADLGAPTWSPDVATSARTGQGLAELAGAIRERLVPGAAMGDARPWRFWE